MAERDPADVSTPLVAPEQLVTRAQALVAGAGGERVVIGVTGVPAAGKSTLAAQLGEATGGVVVPMDGFHLAQAQLERLGLAHVKGALATFDGAGFVSLLSRIVARDEHVVYAPDFRRDIEEPVAGAIAVPREVSLVIVEGNYLLVDSPPWDHVRGLLTECWYLEADSEMVLDRLVERHVRGGRSPEQARAFALASDMVNAEFVSATASRADAVVTTTAVLPG